MYSIYLLLANYRDKYQYMYMDVSLYLSGRGEKNMCSSITLQYTGYRDNPKEFSGTKYQLYNVYSVIIELGQHLMFE